MRLVVDVWRCATWVVQGETEGRGGEGTPAVCLCCLRWDRFALLSILHVHAYAVSLCVIEWIQTRRRPPLSIPIYVAVHARLHGRAYRLGWTDLQFDLNAACVSCESCESAPPTQLFIHSFKVRPSVHHGTCINEYEEKISRHLRRSLSHTRSTECHAVSLHIHITYRYTAYTNTKATE